MNTNYLRQAIRETQIKYTISNEHPLSYFRHLFFTNGNGIVFLDGNPVIGVEFYRTIPYTEYYKDQRSFDDLKEEYFEYHANNDVQHEYKIISRVMKFKQDKKLTSDEEDKAWELAVEKNDRKFDGIELIDNVSDEQLFDSEYWYKAIDNLSYLPYLGLSKGFYKLEELNKNTEISLLKIGLALSKGYLKILEEYIGHEEKYTEKENPFGNNDIDFEKTYLEDIKVLKREKDRLMSIIKGQLNG